MPSILPEIPDFLLKTKQVEIFTSVWLTKGKLVLRFLSNLIILGIAVDPWIYIVDTNIYEIKLTRSLLKCTRLLNTGEINKAN